MEWKNKKDDLVFLWEISGMKRHLEVGSLELESEPFVWKNGIQLRTRVNLELTPESDGLYAWFSVAKDHIYSEPFAHILLPNICLVLKDRNTCGPKQHVVTSFNCPFNTDLEAFLHRKRRVALRRFLTHPFFNRRDTLLFEVRMELPSVAHEVLLTDGLFRWALDNCERRKELEEQGFVEGQESPYIYTGPSGYRVRVKVFLTGHGQHKGKGLTVGIYFLTGQFDRDLPHTLLHETSVFVLDRKDYFSSPEVTVEKDVAKEAEYFIHVCGDERMQQLVDNDVLYFKFEIKAENPNDDFDSDSDEATRILSGKKKPIRKDVYPPFGVYSTRDADNRFSFMQI